MIDRFREVENSYIENFSKSADKGSHIVFWDEKLPDMYAFNFTLVKAGTDEDSIKNFAADNLSRAKSSGREFLKLILHPQIEITDSLVESLHDMGFETDVNLYMKIDGSKAGGFRANEDCTVKIAETEEEYEAGRLHDIETTAAPAEFAERKTLRKKEVFLDPGKKLYSYLCFHEGQIIGKCELHIKDEYAKLEDFDVLEKYQRKGFGTAILKKAILDAAECGIENIYLITGKDDTPREMYGKMGFEIIGEELEVFWKRK